MATSLVRLVADSQPVICEPMFKCPLVSYNWLENGKILIHEKTGVTEKSIISDGAFALFVYFYPILVYGWCTATLRNTPKVE